MKTSLKKLQKFAALRHDKRAQKKHQSLAHDELARATQDMNDTRDCYDRLLSAAAATANSVYEFSEALGEMGDCLLEKTALSDDEESGKVLLMLGKAQFELQKLVDSYRTHIVQTITVPSESLLNELHIVEEMKRQCDEKSQIYEELMKKHQEKGKLRNNKGECFTSHQLQEAHDEYDEESNMFVFRMKSLKQGQSRSLLTQASRHHAAQLCFFKKALRSLEAIDPHVRLVAEQQHIDYQFSALKDDREVVYDVDDDDEDGDDGGESDSNGDSDMENGSKARDNGELSFGFGRSGPLQEVSASRNSMESDNMDNTSSPETKMVAARVILRNSGQNSFSFQGEARAISKSAPLFSAKKFDQAERLAQLRPSASRKFISYVLPTPDETKSPASRKFDNEASQARETAMNLWHLSPLDKSKYGKIGANEKLSGPIILDTHSVLKESNNRKPSPLPPPLTEGLLFKQDDPSIASYAKKVKRQAFSGPLTDKPWTTSSPNLSASGPTASSRYPPPFSGSVPRTPFPRPTSAPKLSSRVTSTFVSSPKISELHELPRPPSHLAPKRTSDRITHSGPIISKRHVLSNAQLITTSAASALPIPPLTLPRSFSIPAGGPMEMTSRVPLDGSQNSWIEDVSSPPLTPIDSPRL